MTVEDGPTEGSLLLIGGAERRDEDAPLLHHLVGMAGGDRARLLVCAAATREPEETLETYRETLAAARPEELWLEPLQERSACEDPRVLDALEAATAVFFTGGDQYRLASLLSGTTFGELVRERLERKELIVAGSSAGAAAMSSTMIVSGGGGARVRRSDVNLGVGLGYLPDAVIDTHFHGRGRIHRLLSVLAQYPQILGVGIDEDTAADIRIGRDLRVLGSGAVTLFDGRSGQSNAADACEEESLALTGVVVHVLPSGWSFDLRSREVIAGGAERDVTPAPETTRAG